MLNLQEGDTFVSGAKAQALVSRAIKLGQTLRFQPATAKIASLVQLVVLALGIWAIATQNPVWWQGILAAIGTFVISVAAVWIVATVGRDRKAYWANMSHAGVVVVHPASGELCLCEALAHGVAFSPIDKYESDNIVFIPSSKGMNTSDLGRFRDFVYSVVEAKTRYGFVMFASLFIYCVTAGIAFMPTLVLYKSGTSICSGFACDALTGPYRWTHEAIFQMPANMWADLADKLDLSW